MNVVGRKMMNNLISIVMISNFHLSLKGRSPNRNYRLVFHLIVIRGLPCNAPNIDLEGTILYYAQETMLLFGLRLFKISSTGGIGKNKHRITRSTEGILCASQQRNILINK